MHFRGPRFVVAIAALVAMQTVFGDEVFEIDSARSHADFEVKVMWFVGIRGDFGAIKGNLTVDRFHGTATVEADIDTNDLHMRTRSYEAWAKSNEFFDSQHFPKIHFLSDSFPLVRLNNGGDIEGKLTLLGIVRPIHFDLDAADCRNPLDGTCPVEAFGLIHRSDFGMQARRGALSDKVQLRLSAFVNATPTDSLP
jgi:polyisoprenoid-binding protein YceI